jgi:hypothetical protein
MSIQITIVSDNKDEYSCAFHKYGDKENYLERTTEYSVTKKVSSLEQALEFATSCLIDRHPNDFPFESLGAEASFDVEVPF